MATTQDELVTLRLLKFEESQLKAPTISRVTFYSGKPPLDYIRGKVAEVCRENPWLEGRLLRQDGRLMLRYPKTSRGVDQVLRVASIPSLTQDMGFAELAGALEDLLIKRGFQCVDKDEVLFRVGVVEISPDRFALVESLSHVFADGHTFYEIHRMLSATEPARALIVDRVYSSRDDMEAAIRGGEDALPWLMSPGFIINVVSSLLRRRKSTVNLFTVDHGKIAERKKEYEAANTPKFISTNDIVTSDFFANTNCDLMFMAVNFRDRIPHLTRNHAGNYECVIAFQREDFERPELIHSSLGDYRRAISGKLPGFFKSTRVKLGAITNLASLYQDVELPGCELLFHRPVVEAQPFLPFENMVYIFKSRKDQLSAITYSRDTSALANVEVFQEQVV